jgi:hypothetical protein
MGAAAWSPPSGADLPDRTGAGGRREDSDHGRGRFPEWTVPGRDLVLWMHQPVLEEEVTLLGVHAVR